MTIHDPEAYAARVMTEFADDVTGADFEARKKLWKSAVVETTIRSALRHARRAA
jgi:hypothetical protein